MYIPKHFAFTDQAAIVTFMQQYSFASLVTVTDNRPVATHMPFMVEQSADGVVLTSHFAKANPQADDIDGKEAMVMFMEPHAYISPSHYEKELNVPTWNYIAVHAYGKATVIEDEQAQLDMMEKMISLYDKPYLNQWANLPMDFKQKMLKGIVAFKIIVTDLQAKKKLSQNRTEIERANIVKHLHDCLDNVEKTLGDYMIAKQV